MKRVRRLGIGVLLVGLSLLIFGASAMAYANESDVGLFGLAAVIMGCILVGTGLSIIGKPDQWR